MSWRDAPVYVEAFDLGRWVIERADSWEHRPLADRATGAAVELVISVSLALTFPANRQRHLAASDEGIVRLRTVLRLAESVGLVSRGGLRAAAQQLGSIGRMVGGWRKRIRKPSQTSEGGKM